MYQNGKFHFCLDLVPLYVDVICVIQKKTTWTSVGQKCEKVPDRIQICVRMIDFIEESLITYQMRSALAS